MSGFIEGENRFQSTLFPESLEDYIAEDNSIRIVDAFVNKLRLKQLGFDRAEPSDTGRPGYEPATMLKIYIYGYLNRIQSSRRLERESHRNVELIWLTGRLMPCFKTIADFRKDNRQAIRRVCTEFVGVCRDLDLYSSTLVAIDGSKFKAVNSRDKNFTRKSVKLRLKKTRANIDRYLAKLDAIDKEEPEIPEVTAKELKQKIASMEAKMEEEIVECYEAGITALVPKTNTSGSKAKGRYSKADFRYDAEANEYICPAGERLTYRYDSVEKGKTLWVYWTSRCSDCLLKADCTTGKERRIKRWEKEHILEAADALLKKNPDAMRQRKKLVEHPFGTIKHWMGSTHFLTKRLPNVQAEMSLQVLTYNLRRAINILGTEKILEQLEAA